SVEERTVEVSEKAFRQLRQLADSVTEAHERNTAIAAELEATKAFMRSMEVALAETTERLDTLTASQTEPAPVPDPVADGAPVMAQAEADAGQPAPEVAAPAE
ncbi:MAG: hypothetical protein M3066_01165, partial [Actinomycetota bacterium]|nr:hypothetical protein [Actinomycetota bacterium]